MKLSLIRCLGISTMIAYGLTLVLSLGIRPDFEPNVAIRFFEMWAIGTWTLVLSIILIRQLGKEGKHGQ